MNNGLGTAVLIILLIIALIWLYKILKPYFLKYDTTLCINGGLGSGKTLTAVKTAIVLIRRQRLTKYYLYNFFIGIRNKILVKINTRHRKYNIAHSKDVKFKAKKIYTIKAKRKKPLLYSNIPIHFKKHLFGTKREWATIVTADMITCFREMREYSVVVLDELPQFINQFNWDEPIVQKNVNEFITFFRHYIGGYMIVTAQAIDDVVVQIRRKLNQAVWCFDFKKWLFGLFYTIRMCDVILSDQVTTMSTTYIEDNTKLHFGLFPARNTYNTRCFSPRYKNLLIKETAENKAEKWKEIKTTKVLRCQQYTSPLDDTTTTEQKKEQYKKGERIWKN